MRDVSALKNHRLRCKPVQTWRVDAFDGVARDQICAQLIGKKDNKIWFGNRLR